MIKVMGQKEYKRYKECQNALKVLQPRPPKGQLMITLSQGKLFGYLWVNENIRHHLVM